MEKMSEMGIEALETMEQTAKIAKGLWKYNKGNCRGHGNRGYRKNGLETVLSHS